MPDDKEIIATIKTQYDGTGAAEAKQDLSSLPEELRPIASSFAESQSQLDELIAAIGEANSALREHINSLAPAAAGYAQARQEATALRDQFVALYRETGQASDSLSATQKRLRDWAGAKGAIPNQEMQELSRRAAQARREVAALGEQMTALSAQRGGLTGGGAGSGEEEQRSRAMAEVMRLETLTRHELNQEIQRLSAARRAAAAAADTTAYQRLTVQLQTARKAMTDLTAAQNLNKTAWAGQAIQGMQVADTIARLASQAQEGKMQVADLANGVIALSLAFKAGMGPIGLVMAGIQGLQYAYDYFTKESTAALEESREELRKYAEELTQLDQTLQKAASSTRELTLQGMAEGINRTATAMQQAAGEQANARKRTDIEAQAQNERDLAAAQSKLQLEKARLSLLVAQGQLTAQESKQRLMSIENEAAARRNQLQQEEQLRRNREALAAKNSASQQAAALREELQRQLGEMDTSRFLRLELPSPEEYAALQMKLNSEIATQKDTARSREIEQQAQRIAAQLKAAGIAVSGGTQDILSWAAGIKELITQTNGTISQLEQQAEAEGQSAQMAKEKLTSLQAEQEMREQSYAAARELAEAQAAAAERAKGWERLEDASLTEQIGYVERMVSATKEGSDEWEQWSRQLRRLHNQAAAKELESIRRLGQDYGRSEDAGAQRAILRRQRQQLSQLAGRGGLSADLQEQIAREQASVRAAMQHWRAETQKAAAQGQQNLLGAKAPDLQATNKGMQGAVRRINTALEAQARQLERETRAGDKQSMSRIGEKMVRLAAQAEKLTGYTGQYADMDGLSAEERKKAEVERKLRAGTQRATTSERAEESRARREQQQQERAARRAAAQQPAAARNAQPAAAAAQGTGAAQAAQGATQAATQAAASAQALTTQLTELQTQLQTQAAAMQEALSACASLAASQASVNAGVKSQLNALKNSIQRLQTRN